MLILNDKAISPSFHNFCISLLTISVSTTFFFMVSEELIFCDFIFFLFRNNEEFNVLDSTIPGKLAT